MTLARRWSRQDDFRDLMDATASRYGVPRALVYAVAGVESAFIPSARSPSGSLGVMQMTPSTARGLGFSGADAALFDPATNIDLGVKLLRQLSGQLGGNAAKIASAYNGGIRPSLGFGEPATQAGRVCLTWADPQKSRCLQWHSYNAGEFGNQPYVEKVLSAYSYFTQYLAERDAVRPPAVTPGSSPPSLGTDGAPVSWGKLGIGLALAAVLAYLIRRFG